jgi:hypothetical protein
MIMAAGCVTTTVTDRQQLVTGQLPRPQIITPLRVSLPL